MNNYFENPSEMNQILSCQIKIPYYLYSNLFLRILSMEPFFTYLNLALRSNNFIDFKQFIYILYSGLNLNIIKNEHNVDLYRFQLISNDEYDTIKNNKLALARTFMSFTKNKEVAISLSNHISKPNYKKVLFVVNALKGKSNLTVTNIDSDKISYFSFEGEVIFLPFSGFEISDIDEKTEPITIYLDYLNKYEKKINRLY